MGPRGQTGGEGASGGGSRGRSHRRAGSQWDTEDRQGERGRQETAGGAGTDVQIADGTPEGRQGERGRQGKTAGGRSRRRAGSQWDTEGRRGERGRQGGDSEGRSRRRAGSQ